MQDDLVQEMSLAVLEYNEPANFGFLFELAGNRAIDYLRYEAARGMLPLSEAREASDQCAEQMSSLNAFIGELLERGVPKEWIEEALGARLEAA
jgi:DNA-directed RNA polymerase specialized sigma24 family protein